MILKLFFILPALALFFCGCAEKELPEQEPEKPPVKVTQEKIQTQEKPAERQIFPTLFKSRESSSTRPGISDSLNAVERDALEKSLKDAGTGETDNSFRERSKRSSDWVFGR